MSKSLTGNAFVFNGKFMAAEKGDRFGFLCSFFWFSGLAGFCVLQIEILAARLFFLVLIYFFRQKIREWIWKFDRFVTAAFLPEIKLRNIWNLLFLVSFFFIKGNPVSITFLMGFSRMQPSLSWPDYRFSWPATCCWPLLNPRRTPLLLWLDLSSSRIGIGVGQINQLHLSPALCIFLCIFL